MKVKYKRLQYLWRAAPMSCTISASTPSARLAWPSFRGTSSSVSKMRTLMVTCPFTPCSCKNSITCGNHMPVSSGMPLLGQNFLHELYWSSTAQSNTHLHHSALRPAKTAMLISMMTCRRQCSQNANFICNIKHTRRREDHPKVAWFNNNKLSASKLMNSEQDLESQSTGQWSKRDPQRTLPPYWLPWIRTFK